MASSLSIETFVFIDFATKPGTTIATTLCLRAVPRVLYLHPDTEEPTDKLLLDFSQNGFNLDTYDEINNYLSRQTKPVCLVAHNGNTFDFPILKQELQKLKVSLSDDVLCADSLYAFYDILIRSDDYVQSHNAIFTGKPVRKIFHEGTNYRKGVSYKLGDIYKRVVETPEIKPHFPENDTLMLVRISRKLKQFLAWTDQIQRMFSDVKPEELDGNFRELD